MSIVQKDKFDTFKVFLAGSHLDIQNHCGINMKFGATIKSHEWYSRESSHFGNDYVMEIITNGERSDVKFGENAYSWYITAKHSGHYYNSDATICIKGITENTIAFTFNSVYSTGIHLIENFIYILLLLNQIKNIRDGERLWNYIVNTAAFSKLSIGEQLNTLIELHKILNPICTTYPFAQEFFQDSFEKLKSIVNKKIDNLDVLKS